jgi:hypothetical protein
VVALIVAAVAFFALTGDDDDADPTSSDRTERTDRDERSDDPSDADQEEKEDDARPDIEIDPDAPQDYGDDARLDALWDDCEEGDFQACDDLYNDSEYGSAYEDFGDTCGERNTPQGYCVDIYGEGDDLIPAEPEETFGSDAPPPGEDATLDALWNQCGDGDFAACDELYRDSAFGSNYEEFARSCGGRNESAGLCEEIYSDG